MEAEYILSLTAIELNYCPLRDLNAATSWDDRVESCMSWWLVCVYMYLSTCSFLGVFINLGLLLKRELCLNLQSRTPAC